MTSASAPSIRWRAIHIACAAIFLLAAVVQYNDPDPWLWMAFYLAPAVLSVGAVFELRVRAFFIAVAMAAIVWGALWVPIVLGKPVHASAFTHWKMIDSGDEEIRELVGIGLVLVWAVAHAVFGWRGRR